MIVEALEQAADKAQNAMLHAQTALIDLKYGDLPRASERATLACQETSEAQNAATRAGAWLYYATQSNTEEKS
jgi:hypothetical protein